MGYQYNKNARGCITELAIPGTVADPEEVPRVPWIVYQAIVSE